ncbi:MAG: AAA family ATPase [Steroidobacter sp.]
MSTPAVVAHTPDASRELETLLRSLIPLVVIETRDEQRVLGMLAQLAIRLTKPVHTPVFQWTVTEGLRRLDIDLGGPQRHNAEPEDVLRSIRASDKAGVYVLLDFHPYLGESVNVRLIKDICQDYQRAARTLVLVSHEIKLPVEIEHFAARFALQFPSRTERLQIVEAAARDWRQSRGSKVHTDRNALEMLVDNLAGLSTSDTERLARKAIFNDGAITMSDVAAITRAKYELLARDGVLSFEHDTAAFADLGGMSRLKEWLQLRSPAFKGSAPELDPPKGVLLLGVQGCGKSLAARVAAGVYGVPLLQLDFGSLYNKYHGESERNLRESLQTAEIMQPCVLWIDEIEKGLASGDGDGGVSKRMLGSFLNWLAGKKGRVFVVATANDIAELPPELIRKGRFDEIFFVDLPGNEVRAEIIRIHCMKRGISLMETDIQVLALHSENFSGAEIEQAIVSAMYASIAKGETVTAQHILFELHATKPLSVVMAEKVRELREWATDRTVAAD